MQPQSGLKLSPRTPCNAHCEVPITNNGPRLPRRPRPLAARSRPNLKLACAWDQVPTETHITCHIVAFPLLAARLRIRPAVDSAAAPTQTSLNPIEMQLAT